MKHDPDSRPTTPYRPLDITVPFPELKDYARTATRLHPRPGAPAVGDSSVGGPLLWPEGEAWPVCREHDGARGVRPWRVRRQEEILRVARARPRPADGAGWAYTDAERAEMQVMTEAGGRPDRHDGSPLPLLALAQFYARDVPDLAAFAPPGADLLQVLWCPFGGHEDGSYSHFGPSTRLFWRRAADVTNPLSAQPEPPIVEHARYLPVPCALHPEQITEYPWADYLPPPLVERIDAWEDAFEARVGRAAPTYQYDLSLAPGWKIGGWESWHRTDLMRVHCDACGAGMRLLLTMDSCESQASWGPFPGPGCPTGVAAGRDEYRAFVCPADPAHPHRMSAQ
ncbi:hypothetical protein EDD98_6028 [Streptomyces sp. PanSC19]|uniref:hypothetical protein n=1 Tax=Streptomyces sp. PanSC19 TaxID=1520455 RepID=UPI000F470E4B|nr:hypothetical protein [Streptomyces sp. PanSC19]ROQ26397.1 hypothetical protein EDD98_6028 [Streptomyces sp. PanSC19]